MKINESAYIPSENYLCVASLLELVLYQFGYSVSRYEISNYFGVNLPIGVTIDKISNYKNIDDPNFFGIVIMPNLINQFFECYNIMLTEDYISINTISEDSFVSLVDKKIANAFILCGYDYGYVHNEEKNLGIGHVSIISEIDDRYAIIFDPGPRNYGFKKIDSDRLFSGIRRKNDGLWCIYSKG
jgi:hypothetical protein